MINIYLSLYSFYPVVIAAAHLNPKIDGRAALKAMILLDEIRGRLSECFPLTNSNTDYAIFGGIASTIVYGALLEANSQQIENAVSMLLSQYLPNTQNQTLDEEELEGEIECDTAIISQESQNFRGNVALTTEMGISYMNQALDGIIEPQNKDISTQSIFNSLWNQDDKDTIQSNISVNSSGENFAIMSMNFRFGCYGALSSGAIYSLVNVLLENPEILEKYSYEDILMVRVRTFTRSWEMLGKPLQNESIKSRNAAVHSIPYLIGRLFSKAFYKR